MKCHGPRCPRCSPPQCCSTLAERRDNRRQHRGMGRLFLEKHGKIVDEKSVKCGKSRENSRENSGKRMETYGKGKDLCVGLCWLNSGIPTEHRSTSGKSWKISVFENHGKSMDIKKNLGRYTKDTPFSVKFLVEWSRSTQRNKNAQWAIVNACLRVYGPALLLGCLTLVTLICTIHKSLVITFFFPWRIYHTIASHDRFMALAALGSTFPICGVEDPTFPSNLVSWVFCQISFKPIQWRLLAG